MLVHYPKHPTTNQKQFQHGHKVLINSYLLPMRLRLEQFLDEPEGLLSGAELPVELGLLHCIEDPLEGRSRGMPQRYKVVASDQACRADLFGRRIGEEPADELVVIQMPVV